MAGKAGKKPQDNGKRLEVNRWQARIDRSNKTHKEFHTVGDKVVKRYELGEHNQPRYYYDKYNILYSSTETIKPSLYAQTPKVMATKRHRDRENMHVTLATMLIETAVQYAMEEVDFDHVLENAIEDYVLPGLGVVWVRYNPQFITINDGEDAYEEVDFEGLALDYVYWKDFICSEGRTWADKWWIGRKIYFNKKKAAERFGEDVANMLSYCHVADDTRDGSKNNNDNAADQALIYEIWDKNEREVIWHSPDYKGSGFLDRRADPYNLKDFWPTPRPLRAISTTKAFLPKPLYHQYQAQAETLDDITQRIRMLTKALRVVGVYDGSMSELNKLLTGTDNKMVAVENWAQFQGNNGLAGSVVYLPIKDIAMTLAELYKQREIAKNEIYEITGFSDIVRGVSKASETLGAQEIKNQWAGGRLKKFQKEVQRYCRDIIAIMGEIVVEKFDDESLAMYAGFEPPEVTPQEQQMAAQYAAAQLQYQQMGGTPPQPPPPTARQQAIETFKKVIGILRDEKQRCSLIGIETDSTILPDEAQERKDRMEFLGQIGAYLQQAGPMALQYPDMRGLLGAIMMFVVRTFRSSRPIEQEFEQFQKQFAAQGQQPTPDGEKGDDGKVKAQAQVQTAQLKVQADQQMQGTDLEFERWKVQQQEETKRQKAQQDHDYRMEQLRIEEAKLRQQLVTDDHAMEMDEEQLEADERRAREADAAKDADREASKKKII